MSFTSTIPADRAPTTIPRTPAQLMAAGTGGRLRAVLSANAATSLVAGLAGVVAPGWWADRLGMPAAWVVAVVAAGLIVFAVDVALVAGRARGSLRTATALITALDLAWVAATVVVVAVASLTTFGVVVAVGVGIGVLDFALAQAWLRRRLAVD